jgi:hypothetical protein
MVAQNRHFLLKEWRRIVGYFGAITYFYYSQEVFAAGLREFL